jgi:hypothetical protein
MTENVLCPCTTAPGISFTQPNLPLLLREIEALVEQATNEPNSEPT